MKRIFIAIALVSTLLASAQTRVSPGFRAGLNLSDISDIDGGHRTNFYLGAYASVKLTRWYALQPEINYSRQGTKAEYFNEFDPVLSTRTETWELDYVGLTVNNKFSPVKGLNLMVGPYLDFLVNHTNLVNPRNDVDSGLTLGVGYTFSNGIGVEARYKAGFVDIFQDYHDDFDSDDYHYYNQAFQIGVSYTFNLKKK